MTSEPIANLAPKISDDEILIRGLSSDVCKNGKLHWRAFRPSVGNPLVSVMRGLMGANFCKNKSKEIAANKYVGMAALSVFQVLETGAAVHDAQDEYPGHAHIDHIDPPVQPHNPIDPVENAELNNRCRKLAELSRIYIDSAPLEPEWPGPEIV